MHISHFMVCSKNENLLADLSRLIICQFGNFESSDNVDFSTLDSNDYIDFLIVDCDSISVDKAKIDEIETLKQQNILNKIILISSSKKFNKFKFLNTINSSAADFKDKLCYEIFMSKLDSDIYLKNSIKPKITSLLLRFGFNIGQVGFHMLIFIVEYLIKNDIKAVNLHNDLYIRTAKVFEVSPTAVEVSIRRAIRSARVKTGGFAGTNKHASNKEVIYYLVMQVLNEA